MSRRRRCHCCSLAPTLGQFYDLAWEDGYITSSSLSKSRRSRLPGSHTFNEAVTQGGFHLLEEEKKQCCMFQAFSIPLMRSLSNLKLLLVTQHGSSSILPASYRKPFSGSLKNFMGSDWINRFLVVAQPGSS